MEINQRTVIPHVIHIRTQRVLFLSGRARALRFLNAPFEPDDSHRFIHVIGGGTNQTRSVDSIRLLPPLRGYVRFGVDDSVG